MEDFWKRFWVTALGAFLIGVVNGMFGIEYTAAIVGNLMAGFLLGRIIGFIK